MKKLRKSKIKDNTSYSELSKTAYGMLGLSWIIFILAKFRIVKDSKFIQPMKEISKLVEQTEEMISLPDKFNHHFSSLGWIAYESMNAELMKKCIMFAENKKIDEAERLLIEYFDEKNIKTHIMWLKAIKAFLPRWELVQSACDDYIAGRYYSSIPVVLLTIDGLVNDVAPDQKGFFATNPDVTAWDSIAGHSSGLKKLAKIFGAIRKKTTTDEIKTPFRNGIMHGRDINYANKTVAAKTWSALFAVGDWAKQVQSGKKEKPIKKEKKITWKEIFQSLQKTEAQKKLINEWKPRKLKVGQDFLKSGAASDYKEGTPEKVLVEILDFTNKKNYGEMAKRITTCTSVVENQKAGELRDKFNDIKIQDFCITEIRDEAAAISEVVAVLNYKSGDKNESKEITARMIFQDSNHSPLARNSPGGSWRMIEWCLDSICDTFK